MSDRIRKWTVFEEGAGQRLDKWLASHEEIASRSRATELIVRGNVTLNGKPLKASQKLLPGMTVEVELPEPTSSRLIPLDRPLDLLYEDEDIAVVNKPSGLVVHPAAGHAQDTLVNLLLHHVKSLSLGFAEQRPGIVHRLDRDTSGILVVAKNDQAHRHLADQFRHKTAHRAYWAIVHGRPVPADGTIKSLLARHPQDRKRFASHSGERGKLAITHYRTLQTVPARLSWIRCRLETGRTHQIRVHLSEKGNPIVGDPIYGRKARQKADRELGRLALHACELGFVHPRKNEEMRFFQPWPPEMLPFLREAGFRDV
jgi:23S rRNA pseudouridine1911/1915/1917 synthase